MIDKYEDLNILDDEEPEDVDKKIQDKLGISLQKMREALSDYINDNVDLIIEDMINIAPYEDYEKLIEDQAGMVSFLKEEVVKEENWRLEMIRCTNQQAIHFRFLSAAVDDGTTFKGVVIVNFSGKILHAFCQGEC